jgi:D-alanine-D-alanine ligase
MTVVAVIFGGRSSEHEISCISAGGILRALDPTRYQALPIGVTKDGRWVLQPVDPTRLVARDGQLPTVVADGPSVELVNDASAPSLRIEGRGRIPVDVAFPVLHGPWGEDGTVQGALETAGLPFVGSGVGASALCMDKGLMKVMLQQAGLPTGPSLLVTDQQWLADPVAILQQARSLGERLFVKPARAGSSLGITLVDDSTDEYLRAAIELARQHDPRVIIEAAITPMREVECAVIVEAQAPYQPKASVCSEIVVRQAHRFYDFAAKYLEDAADLHVPADLPAHVAQRVQSLATQAFAALGCEGLARVDFFVRPDGSVLINELNTMPGFTPISMFPRMWQVSGLDYPALVDHLIADALRRGIRLR